MKKYLPALMALFLLASCSGDDSSPTDNDPDPVDPDTGIFTKIVETVHESHGDYKITYDYTDGKLMRKSYSVDGDVTYYYDYGYNAAGLLVSESMVPFTNIPPTHATYTYDNLGRISHIETTRDGEPYGELTYIYNGNTVTSVNGDGQEGTKTYTLNNGLVVREFEEDDTFGDWFYDIEYNGTNAVFASHNFGQSEYTYDTVHDAGILGITDGNGTFKANSALRYRNMFAHTITDIAANYVLTETHTDTMGQTEAEIEYTYTFSPGGRPLTRMMYRNGELASETEYIYEAP